MEKSKEIEKKQKQIMLNTQIIADEILSEGWNTKQKLSNGTPNLKYFEIYKEKVELSEDTLYFVPESKKDSFPSDEYCYVCCADIDGKAPHISCIDADQISVIDKIINIFQKYRDYEIKFNNIIINNMSLDNLCMLGSELFNNPLYVHDRNFSILSISERIPGMLEFEKSEAIGGLQIPLWLVDQFKFDKDYANTLIQTNASIWGTDQYPHNIRSLYLNIRDGSFYYGRVLINEIKSSILPGQFRLIEIFGEYVKEIMFRDQVSHTQFYTRYEDLFKRIARGDTSVNATDLSTFFRVRGWSEADEYLCLIFQTQDERLSIRSESAMRAILMEEFKEAFDFFNNQQLCMILNMTKMNTKTTIVKNTLATVVRDSYMYCGISNRIEGYQNLATGFNEAEIALDYVKSYPNEWIRIFVDVALNYTLDNIHTKLKLQQIIAPQLYILDNYDKQNGTEYYKTLRSYLVNERDITKTSKELVIHRTTLTHRLEQMKKVANLELDDEDRRLYFLISIRLYEKEKLGKTN